MIKRAAIAKGNIVVQIAVPTNTSVPTITGSATVGSTLNATTGTWANNPTSFTYQWKSAGVNATGPGALTNAYTPIAPADIGNTLTVYVTARNAAGSSAAAPSIATSAVTAGVAGMLNFSQASDSVLIGAVFA
jgi:hypothetical protein